jgi:DNA-binding NtrC family response regulator
MHMVPRTQGSERVLLVEDDEAVRTLTRTVLQRQGYQVIEARHGQDAVAIAATQDQPVHLLVSDVVMPHMNGQQLYQELSQRWPGLKVLFISGYTEGAIDDLAGEPHISFLQKPFTPEAFAQKTRELLDRR